MGELRDYEEGIRRSGQLEGSAYVVTCAECTRPRGIVIPPTRDHIVNQPAYDYDAVGDPQHNWPQAGI
eukprot:16013509-Heterocapsa_arctica.AAC.1